MENAVLSNDMLLHIILKHAIPDCKSANYKTTITSLRLVDRRWLQTVSEVLKKRKQPLFRFFLNTSNGTNGSSCVQEEKNNLDQFVRCFTNTSRVHPKVVPPFMVQIKESFFYAENLASLSNFLVHCGNGLLDLEMFMPTYGGTLAGFLPPGIKLPILQSLTVRWTHVDFRGVAEESPVGLQNMNPAFLIHSLLNATEKLNNVSMPMVQRANPLPNGFEYIFIPASIVNLNLTCGVRDEHLELLAKSTLPNLKLLQLLVLWSTVTGEVLGRALSKFGCKLETLALLGRAPMTSPIIPIELPVMHTLDCFSTSCIEFNLKENVSSFNACFTKLTRMVLEFQTDEMIRKWTENARYVTVENLFLRLVSGNMNGEIQGAHVMSINLETMQRIDMAFCNLKHLSLGISIGQTCGLKYLFMEMRRLKSFKIILSGGSRPGASPYVWDSLLVGITEKFSAALRENSEYFDLVELNNDRLPSIRNLTELATLTLLEDIAPQLIPGNDSISFISDIAFKHALLKMPKLKFIYLSGRFKASGMMVQRCKDNGKTLAYTAHRRQ